MTDATKNSEHIREQVFISYASEEKAFGGSDQQVAVTIHSALVSQGICCWMAEKSITPGKNWPDEIYKAIEQSKIMIVIVSSKTEKSEYVIKEVTEAVDKKVLIIPFYIENVPIHGGLRLLLRNYQWIHAYRQNMREHLDQLLNAVFIHLGIEQGNPPKKKYKKPEESGDMPEDIEKVRSKADALQKNNNGYWETYYQDNIVMVYIPPGKFIMGSNNGDDNEKPPHEVDLNGYWISKYEVTFDQYDTYCKETQKEKPCDNRWGREKRPVINVSWYEASSYCDWLSQKLALKFKLPSEAQWEKAARGNDNRKYPWGSHQEPAENLANFAFKVGKTTQVGDYPDGASPYGLLDMAGNVWEWCNDWYNSFYYKNSPSKNPIGPSSGTDRVIRGGGWYDSPWPLHCANRDSYGPSNYGRIVGFRLCQEI